MKSKITIEKIDVEKILKRIGKTLDSYFRLSEGYINPAYHIFTKEKDQYILRLTNPIWKRRKTLNEITVMEFLRKKTTIPVPEVFDHDLTTNRIGHEYILMEWKPGKSLEIIWKKLTPKEKKQILKQIAKIFVELKKYKFKKIGSFKEGMKVTKLVDPHEGPFGSFNEYIAQKIAFRIPPLQRNKRFKHYVPKFELFLKNVVEPYRTKVPITLNHGDLFKNILCERGNITALLDFEWMQASPIDQDYLELGFLRGAYKTYFTKELKKRKIPFPEGIEERKIMYEVSRLATALVSYTYWYEGKPKEGERYIQKEIKRLDKIFSKTLKNKI